MQLFQTLDQTCANKIPYYSGISSLTTRVFTQGKQNLSLLYQETNNKAQEISLTTKTITNDLIWLASQLTDDLLFLIETKINLEAPAEKIKERTKRIQRIYKQLKKQGLQPYLTKISELNKSMMLKGKQYHQEFIAPLYLRIRATVEVSRELLFEAFTERLTQLRMTYKVSKDSIIMFWKVREQFCEEQLAEKAENIGRKLGSLKSLTVNFVQKGMEIKISKKDLVENYHIIMEKLGDVMKEMGGKGVEQWTETKVKTVDLYQTVLQRIKRKEKALMSSTPILDRPTETHA